MFLQSGITHGLDFRLGREPARDFHRILAMPLHPQRERFQSTQREKTIEGPGNRADRILEKRNLITELLVFSHDDDPANHIGMAIQIFCRGMNNHIESEFDRPLNPWSGEGVIGDGDRIVRTRDFRHRLQIDQLQERIARRLHPNHPGVWSHFLFDCFCIGHVDEGEIEIGGASPHPLKKPEGASVEIIAHHHVRTAVEPVQRRGHRREPRGEGPAARSAFEIGNATLVGAPGRID